MDADSEFKKLDDFEIKKYEENEEIKTLLSSARKSYKFIDVGGRKIKIRAYMQKATRKKLIKVGKAYNKTEDVEDIDIIEAMFYPIVAEMCIDPPFNDPKAWQYIDEQEGCIEDVVSKILAAVNETEGGIKSFR